MGSKQYISIMLILAISACKPKLKIEIDLANTPEQEVKLEHFYKDSFITLSEKHINDGKFTLSSEPIYPSLLRVRYSLGKYLFFSVVEGDKTIKVTGDWEGFDNVQYIGSESTDDLQTFMKGMQKFASEQNAYEQVKAQLKGEQGKDSLYRDAVKRSEDSRINFDISIEQYINSSPYLLNKLFVLRFLNRNVKQSFMDSTLNELKKQYPDNLEMIYTYNLLSSDTTQIDSTQSADKAPEISSTTPQGQNLKLSDLRGRYVLIDFWASWCPPCRAVNPSLVKFYKKLKGKNFTILGVSLDKTKDKWVEAIKEDKLDWLHVSDLNGWQGIYVRDYDFNSIPYNVLVDPQGAIIAKNLNVKQLEVKLAELLPESI